MGEADRRRHSRFHVDDAPAELRRTDLVALWGLTGLGRVQGGVVNISEGGIRVSVPSALPTNRKVRCKVSSDRFRDPLDVVGQVLWCERDLMSENGYLVGITFEGLEPRHQRRIAAMREWFSSAEYQAQLAARRRRLG